MVTPEYKRLERYIWGLPQSIQGNVIASRPVTLSSAIRLAHDLMDQVIRHSGATKTAETRSNDNKRKLDENQERSYEQHPYKEPNVIKAYYVGQSSNSSYLGTKPFCNICKRHHTKECREVAWGNNSSCFNCGEKGHFRRNCPMFLDQDNEQQHEEMYQDTEPEHEEVLMITDGDDYEDPNFDMGTSLLNNPKFT